MQHRLSSPGHTEPRGPLPRSARSSGGPRGAEAAAWLRRILQRLRHQGAQLERLRTAAGVPRRDLDRACAALDAIGVPAGGPSGVLDSPRGVDR